MHRTVRATPGGRGSSLVEALIVVGAVFAAALAGIAASGFLPI
ncbi:MAG TPA: hypothetical protein VMU93_09390 [Caulobacteraceae bacterium]|nr:hypothetical protein [Caulobacteraceae bacterium]